MTKKSRDYYLKAFQINPLDAEAAYGLAMGEARLEQLYHYLRPGKKGSPYAPLPYFRQAVQLRPNGILYNYSLACYLYKKEKNEEFISAIHKLVYIYPYAYYSLKKEDFWSPSVRSACKSGLMEAAREKIIPRAAHTILSLMMAEDKEWPAAISHYQEALKYKTYKNRSEDYIYLGRLYLINRQPEQAETSFFRALDLSRSREQDLKKLYSVYKNAGYPEELLLFYQKADRRFTLSSQVEILISRCLIELKQYQQARQILTGLNKKEPNPEAYYWLARIAEAEKDWDTMELAIQRATVLDPENRNYHHVFSYVLKQLKKYDRAEKEAALASENR